MAVSVVENVWKRVHSLVKLREIEVAWLFESGKADDVVVNVLKGINKLFPERIWAA